jgi:hypothetical protein
LEQVSALFSPRLRTRCKLGSLVYASQELNSDAGTLHVHYLRECESSQQGSKAAKMGKGKVWLSAKFRCDVWRVLSATGSKSAFLLSFPYFLSHSGSWNYAMHSSVDREDRLTPSNYALAFFGVIVQLPYSMCTRRRLQGSRLRVQSSSVFETLRMQPIDHRRIPHRMGFPPITASTWLTPGQALLDKILDNLRGFVILGTSRSSERQTLPRKFS